ncbi:hypothetical protein P691DRAFT_810757, partial [Macrolepiota fuliginosa MF-IS2]
MPLLVNSLPDSLVDRLKRFIRNGPSVAATKGKGKSVQELLYGSDGVTDGEGEDDARAVEWRIDYSQVSLASTRKKHHADSLLHHQVKES